VAATVRAVETVKAEMTRGAEGGTATAVAATVRAVETKVAEMTRGAERGTATARARETEAAQAGTRAAQTATAQAAQVSRAQTATAQAAQVSRAQTATAEASRQRCFEAVRRHWETSSSGLGEVGGVVLDRNGNPFTQAQVRIRIEKSDFVRLVGISPDGMYNFCCLSLGSNWHLVDLVGSNITSTVYKFQTPGWEGKQRVLVDFKEVSCR
jgi:hypothetical protein